MIVFRSSRAPLPVPSVVKILTCDPHDHDPPSSNDTVLNEENAQSDVILKLGAELATRKITDFNIQLQGNFEEEENTVQLGNGYISPETLRKFLDLYKNLGYYHYWIWYLEQMLPLETPEVKAGVRVGIRDTRLLFQFLDQYLSAIGFCFRVFEYLLAKESTFLEEVGLSTNLENLQADAKQIEQDEAFLPFPHWRELAKKASGGCNKTPSFFVSTESIHLLSVVGRKVDDDYTACILPRDWLHLLQKLTSINTALSFIVEGVKVNPIDLKSLFTEEGDSQFKAESLARSLAAHLDTLSTYTGEMMAEWINKVVDGGIASLRKEKELVNCRFSCSEADFKTRTAVFEQERIKSS